MVDRPIPPPETAITGLNAPHGGLLCAQSWYDFFRNVFTTLATVVAQHPTTSTDNAIARYDGTTGKLQDSGPQVSDGGNIYLNDKAVVLRNIGDDNHGMFYNATIDGPEYRGFSGHIWKTDINGIITVMEIDNGSLIIGGGALATNATDGFVYVPTCPGVPTGTPTTRTGRAPIVIDTTNNRLYFFSNGVWRNAGP